MSGCIHSSTATNLIAPDGSRMTESALWATVRDALSPFGILHRVENSCPPTGMPDVFYSLRHPRTGAVGTGWIELKHIAAWPARTETRVHIPSLTIDQVRWQEEWSAAGVRVTMILRTPSGFHMLPAGPLWRALLAENGVIRDDLFSIISGVATVGLGRFPKGAILSCLTS